LSVAAYQSESIRLQKPLAPIAIKALSMDGSHAAAGVAGIPTLQVVARKLRMNSFDAVVYAVTAIAVVTGFKAGLLRSLATIGGYVVAMPLSVALTPLVAPLLSDRSSGPMVQSQTLFFIVFFAIGILFGAVFRLAVAEFIGTTISLPDRLAGAMLGAVRIGLVAVTLVLIFDRIIPAGRQPAFLAGSKLRPVLLAAGQAGLKSLPPDVTAYIDQLKRERRI
jgi:membrane protein required for colicin V production